MWSRPISARERNSGEGPGEVLAGLLGVLVIIMLLAKLLYPPLLFLVRVTLVLAAVGVLGCILFVWVPRRQTSAYVRKILAQLEGQEPKQVLPAVSTKSVEWQETVLIGFDWWGLTMTFVRDTEAGEIHTKISLEREGATVLIVLNGTSLEDRKYSNVGQDAMAVRRVREWMRSRILPELQAAKRLRESESRRLAASAAEAASKIEAKRQEYRRKYLP